jgi:hypothetical protein
MGLFKRGQTKYILDSIVEHQTLLNQAPKSIIHYTTYKRIIKLYILQLIRPRAPYCTKYHDPQQTCLWQSVLPLSPLPPPPTPPSPKFYLPQNLRCKVRFRIVIGKTIGNYLLSHAFRQGLLPMSLSLWYLNISLHLMDTSTSSLNTPA